MTARSGIPIGGPADLPVPLSIAVDAQGGVVRIAPSGELDIATVGQLQSELDRVLAARPARIVIDLREVEFLDSTGLHALVTAHARAQRDNWDLTIIPGPRPVQRLFEITCTIDRLPFAAPQGAGLGPTRSVTADTGA